MWSRLWEKPHFGPFQLMKLVLFEISGFYHFSDSIKGGFYMPDKLDYDIKRFEDVSEPESKSISSIRTRGMTDAIEGVQDLVVSENDRVTLSYQIEQFRPSYEVIKSNDIDEIKRVIGIPKEIESVRRPSFLTTNLRTFLPSKAFFDKANVVGRTNKNIHDAAMEYVCGEYRDVESWAPMINEYLGRFRAELHIARLRNITINDGGVLTVSRDTHSLYANSIKIYGSGAIVAKGHLTIDCLTLDGREERQNLSGTLITSDVMEGVR